jgi:hypothetical protein
MSAKPVKQSLVLIRDTFIIYTSSKYAIATMNHFPSGWLTGKRDYVYHYRRFEVVRRSIVINIIFSAFGKYL